MFGGRWVLVLRLKNMEFYFFFFWEHLKMFLESEWNSSVLFVIIWQPSAQNKIKLNLLTTESWKLVKCEWRKRKGILEYFNRVTEHMYHVTSADYLTKLSFEGQRGRFGYFCSRLFPKNLPSPLFYYFVSLCMLLFRIDAQTLWF